MAIVNISIVNPDLKKFLFESRKIVLKSPFNGFGYRCYTKYLDGLYQYLTMVPNSGHGNMPVDFLTKYNGKKLYANMLIGDFITEIPLSEYNRLYNEIEKIAGLVGHLDIPSDKLKELEKYYSLKIYSDETIERMLLLRDRFDHEINNSLVSTFDYMYYQYYLSVESSRKQRLDCALLSEKIDKVYTK